MSSSKPAWQWIDKPIPKPLGLGSEHLIDTHVHLGMDPLDQNLEAMLSRAYEAGIKKFICIGAGSGMEGNHAALKIANEHMDVVCTVGIHPHDAKLYNTTARDELISMAADRRVRAIGEIGLDFHYNFSSQKEQQNAFVEQLEIAYELDLPVILHVREAHAAVQEVLKNSKQLPTKGIVLHCFTGNEQDLKFYLDYPCLFGIGGVVTFKTADSLRDVVAQIPMERLLLETDAPYLAPAPYRGKCNEPSLISVIAQKVAEVMKVDLSEVATQTSLNATKLFRLNH